jgi:hypothetical protein
MPVRHVHFSPLSAGLVLGFGAALVQAYFKVIPPLAYGICMVCHPKDLFNWIADHMLKTGICGEKPLILRSFKSIS